MLGVLLLLPLGLPPAERVPSGFHWRVDVDADPHHGTLEVEAPIAVVESILPLPLILSTRGVFGAVDVDLCESSDCLLPQRVVVPPGVSLAVDALFLNRSPYLRIAGDGGSACCARNLGAGRAVAFAGPDLRDFAFSSAQGQAADSAAPGGAIAVDAGTLFLGRPDLLDGFGAVLVDDGWAPQELLEPLGRFVARGGVLSMLEADARALGLVAGGAATPMLARGGGDLAMRLDDRVVRLRAARDPWVRIGGGALILRSAGRAEDERLGQIVLVDPEFTGLGVQLDPRQLPIVNVVSAGLSPQRQGAAGFAVVVVSFLGIGLALWRGLKRGPVVAAQRAVVVAVAGALVLIGMRLALSNAGEVKLLHLGPGEGGRRAVAALGRSPASFAEVNLSGASGRFAGPPSTAAVVGEAPWRTKMREHGGEISADLSSSAGLVGLWFGTDDTPGGLRLLEGGQAFTNTLPWRLDWVLLSREDSDRLHVVKNVAPGSTVRIDEAVVVASFGSVLEERFARDVFNNCGRCAVAIATVDGVLTAIEGNQPQDPQGVSE